MARVSIMGAVSLLFLKHQNATLQTSNVNTSKYQAGGTFILGLNQTQSRVVSKGQDKSGLGRWTWFRIQGRHNSFTTVFSVYRPCKNEDTQGTTYRQQKTSWENKGRIDCPSITTDNWSGAFQFKCHTFWGVTDLKRIYAVMLVRHAFQQSKICVSSEYNHLKQ